MMSGGSPRPQEQSRPFTPQPRAPLFRCMSNQKPPVLTAQDFTVLPLKSVWRRRRPMARPMTSYAGFSLAPAGCR